MDVDQCLKWSVLLCLFIGLQQELSHALQDFEECNKYHIGQLKLFNMAGQDLTGVIQICINGILGPQFASLCFTNYSLFTKATAAVACRQKDFVTVADNKFGPASMFEGLESPNDSRYYIVDIQCPLAKDIAADGELNLLRCGFLHTATNITTACGTDQQFAAVTCNPAKIYHPSFGYNGQVYIDNVELYHGHTQLAVYILLRNTSLPICISDFNENIAHSVCQQLGYTGYLNYQIYADSEIQQSWYLQGNKCNDTPFSCFTHCYDTTNITIVSICTSGVGFGLNCIYSVSESALYGSGSKGLCQTDSIEATEDTQKFNDNETIASIVLNATFGLFGFGTIVVLIGLGMYKCYHFITRRWNNRRQRNRNGRGEAQPLGQDH